MYCWFNKEINIVIFVIAIILIGANFYLSIIKGSTFLSKISNELKETKDKNENPNVQKKIDDVEHIKKTVWIYPITSGVLWFLFFIFQILFNYLERHQFLSWIYCILISIRQSIYAIIFLYTQKDIQNQLIKTLLCKKKKKMRIARGIINDIKSGAGGNLLPDDEKIN